MHVKSTLSNSKMNDCSEVSKAETSLNLIDDLNISLPSPVNFDDKQKSLITLNKKNKIHPE